MNENEVIKIIRKIVAVYPQYYQKMNNQQKDEMISLWLELFVNDDFDDAMYVVKEHILFNKFPPTISEIKSAICDLHYRPLTSEEAWDLLHSDEIRWQSVNESFDELPIEIKLTVKKSENLQMYIGIYSDNNKKTFINKYNEVIKKCRRKMMEPDTLKKQRESLTTMVTESEDKK